MAGPQSPPASRRKLRTLLVVVALFIGLPLLVTAINRAIQPQRHAESARCLERDAGGSMLNRCDYPIVAAYCHRGESQDRNEDPCEIQSLEPGQAFTDYPAISSTGAPYFAACKAPFIPKWAESLSNAAIQRPRCRQPDRAP